MAKTKVQEYDSTAANNSDIDGIDIAENCAAANMNNALRELMAHIKAALSGSDDSIVTGTSGTADNLLKWNGDGDAVDSGFTVLDEDDFASDSAAGVPTQQSVKAWVEGKATGADTAIVSGTAGTENHLVKWNGDGDAVDHGVAPTAGRILYGNGTSWVALEIGTAGQVLRVNSGATAPEWGAAGWDFEATETNTGNGSYTVAHGLGVVPSVIAVSAVCKQATGNVTVGAEIPISGVAGYGMDTSPTSGTSGTVYYGMSVWADDTNIYFHHVENTGIYGDFYDGSTAQKFNQNSNADYDFIFRARVS